MKLFCVKNYENLNYSNMSKFESEVNIRPRSTQIKLNFLYKNVNSYDN